MEVPRPNPDFRKLWGGQAISHLGSSVTSTALPLAAIALHPTPFQMGLLSGSGAIVILVFGLFAGAWADRLRRRPILIVADLGRAAVLGSIPLAALLHRLDMRHLYFAAAAGSLLTILFEVSFEAYLPSLVESEELVDANGKMALASSSADVAGPGVAGMLVDWITAPIAILLDAVSFLVSAFSLALIRKPEPAPEPSPHPDMLREITEGLRASWSHPILRVLLFRSAAAAFFLGFGGALFMLFAVTVLGVRPSLLGVLISVGGATSLCGAFAAPRLVARFGLGPTIVGAAFVTGITMLVPTLAHGPILLGVAQLFDMAWPIYNINELSLRQAVTPDQLRGRVNSAMHLLFSGILPVGSFVGGILAGHIGVRTAMFVGALGYLLTTLLLFFSPIRQLKKLPA